MRTLLMLITEDEFVTHCPKELMKCQRNLAEYEHSVEVLHWGL